MKPFRLLVATGLVASLAVAVPRAETPAAPQAEPVTETETAPVEATPEGDASEVEAPVEAAIDLEDVNGFIREGDYAKAGVPTRVLLRSAPELPHARMEGASVEGDDGHDRSLMDAIRNSVDLSAPAGG